MKQLLFSFVILAGSRSFSQQPEPALPEFSNLPHVRDFVLSADRSEAFFTVQSPFEEIGTIVTMRQENGTWSKPELMPFSSKFRDIEPFISADGLRLYFSSNRPIKGETQKDYDIWYVERKDVNSRWSEPINMGSPVNTEANEFYPSLATSGNLYFTSDADAKTKDDIRFCRWNGRKFETPAVLENTINTAGLEFNAYVAPDESFLIFTAYNRPEGTGSGDLYISYKKDGKWQQATNLGPEINSRYMDYCPFYDAATGTLYFTSRRSDVKAADYLSFDEFVKEASQYANGISRIYKVIFAVQQ